MLVLLSVSPLEPRCWAKGQNFRWPYTSGSSFQGTSKSFLKGFVYNTCAFLLEAAHTAFSHLTPTAALSGWFKVKSND